MVITKKIKGAFARVYNLLRFYRSTTHDYTVPNGEKIAVVNFGGFLLNTDMGRFAFILCQLLYFSGFKVVLRLDKKFFYRNSQYKKLVLEQDYKFVRTTRSQLRTITLYGAASGNKVIDLVNGYELIENPVDAYYLPFTLHPRFYKFYLDKASFEGFRLVKRNMGILFAGNADAALYDGDVLKENFKGILSRVEVLEYLEVALTGNALTVHDYDCLTEMLKTNMLATQFVVSEARIPDNEWLRILANANFYLCLPGVRMPWSHNAYEAMSVGTIPIIQYSYLLNPPLVHMENCLNYRTAEELENVIGIALAMDNAQLEIMKRNVIGYYDRYIATETIMARFNAFFEAEADSMKIAIPYLHQPLKVPVM